MPRQRIGSGGLPAIRVGFDQDVDRYTPRSERAYSRLDVLEDRLGQTEKATNSLMEKAFKIKEDVVDSLNYTHGTWTEEKTQRALLSDHIRTITDVVKKLNQDVSNLEMAMQNRQVSSEGTHSAVKTLELQQVAGITDLRGRVARCDGAIAKLSQDLKICYDSIKSVSAQQQDQNNKILDRLQNLDMKLNDLGMRVERKTTEHQLKIKHVEGDSSSQLASLDSKTRGLIEETRNSIATYRAIEETEREKLEARLTSQIDKISAAKDSKMEKSEKKIDEELAILNRRTHKLEQDFEREADRNISTQAAMEKKLFDTLDRYIKKQADEILRLKNECREGFSTVHETITHMKQVMDGKRKLVEEQLRKEISQIRKMVVLI